MKIFLSLFPLVVGAVLMAQPALAAEPDETENFADQITAIANYLDRTFTDPANDPLTNGELQSIIRTSNGWMENIQEKNGHFRYEYIPYTDELVDDDNIVRQAGALYALGEIARRDTNDVVQNEETIESAIEYFEDLSKEDTWNGTTFRCIATTKSSLNCLLGATSLALAGILGYVSEHPEKEEEYDDLITDYATFVLLMKMEGVGFRKTYRIEKEIQDDTESPYFNGESLVALAHYYRLRPSEEVQAVIDDAFTQLRDREFDAPLYLWIMAALKPMQELWPNEAYVAYAKAYTNWRIQTVQRFKHAKMNFCAYSEGLASAYSILEEHSTEEEKNVLRKELAFWNKAISHLQIRDDDAYRVMNTDGVLSLEKLPNPRFALGGFLTSEINPVERVDFTQHCIGAYLQTLVDIEGETLK